MTVRNNLVDSSDAYRSASGSSRSTKRAHVSSFHSSRSNPAKMASSVKPISVNTYSRE